MDDITIVTNSQSALQSVGGDNSKNELLMQAIYQKLRSVVLQGKRVHFTWTPSDSAIGGNEDANRLKVQRKMRSSMASFAQSRTSRL